MRIAVTRLPDATTCACSGVGPDRRKLQHGRPCRCPATTTRWRSSTARSACCRRSSGRCRRSRRGSCGCACTPAACVVPTCTSSMASCRPCGCRACRATRSSAASSSSARAACAGALAIASACPGCMRRASTARTAKAGARTCARRASFTGWSVDGGYAEYAVCNEDYAVAVPPSYSDEDAAPLLCAGLIGYRALRMLPARAGDRPVRLRRRGASDRAGGVGARAACLRVHAARRRCGAAACAVARRALGGRFDAGAAGADGRRDHLRAGRRAGAARAAAGRARRHRRVRGHPHERHPVVSVSLAVEGTRRAIGGQPDARDAHEFMAFASNHTLSSAPRAIRSQRPIERSTTCAAVASSAPRCCAALESSGWAWARRSDAPPCSRPRRRGETPSARSRARASATPGRRPEATRRRRGARA